MRALIVALAMAGIASAASAQGIDNSGGEGVRHRDPTPWVPNGVQKQAVDAIKHGLADPESATFHAVRATEVATIKHSAFEAPIDGPISVVCGQYATRDSKGGAYAWFLVAIKRGHILWTTLDDPSGEPGNVYYSCQNAGLAH